LRNAAAEARRLLLAMAARRLDVTVEQLTVSDGVVTVRSSRQQNLLCRGYRRPLLRGADDMERRARQRSRRHRSAKPKRPDQYKIVGRSIAATMSGARCSRSPTTSTDLKCRGCCTAA